MSGLEDAGFLDPEAARATAKRWAEHRRKTSIAREADDEPQFIKKCAHCGSNIGLSFFDKLVANCLRLLKCFHVGIGNNPRKSSDVGEKEGADCVQPGFEIDGHDGSSESLNDEEATPRPAPPESKKGDRK